MEATLTHPLTAIGRYRIDREIGSGGMAAAFRCVLDGPSGFQKFVLVKMLHPDHRDSAHYYGMFLDEARLCARLQHPNIPMVFELGEHDDLPFLVMEYVDGPNLVMLHRKFRDGHRRPYGHLAMIFERIARALHYAHTLKDADGRPLRIVHRDVSLANILIGRDGHPKLIDFGIAKWDQSESVTEVDVLKGKLRYMAPEQFHKAQLDGRVDVYQTGVAMYWLGTGRPPFGTANGVDELKSRFESMPPRPSSIIHGFPPGLEKVILKCLEPKPERRYQSCQDLADALDGFVRSDPAYNSSEASLSSWIQDLFPGNEIETYTSRGPTGTIAQTTTRSFPAPLPETTSGGSSMPPPSPQPVHQAVASPADSISQLGWLGLVAIAVLSAVVGVQLSEMRRAPVATEGGDAAEMLDHAEAALHEKNFIVARKMLLRVDKMDKKSAAIEERVAELEAELERVKAIEDARRAADNQNYAQAIEIITRLLADVPNDQDAQRLLRELRARQELTPQDRAALERVTGGPPPPPL